MRDWATLLAAAVVFLPVDAAAATYSDTVPIGPPASQPYTGASSWVAQTTVQIRETEEPGAVAEVEFRNASVNNSERDDGREMFIEYNGIVVEVIFDHDYQGGSPDQVTILVPDGYHCLPSCEMLVEEEDSDIVYIIEWVFSDANDSLLVPLPLVDGA